MVKGAYIHIPFCEHICYYCDFNKFFIKNQPVDKYLSALEEEMSHMTHQYSASDLETIFLGGGTPTALTESQFENLMVIINKYLMNSNVKEFTVEANPENMTINKLQIMKNWGVNRLSIGVQTFNNDLLRAIGRAHTSDGAKSGINEAKKQGLYNFSIDLMFGLPGQTEEDLSNSINQALDLNPKHVSIYSLQVEPRTIFYNRMKKGRLKLPSEDIEAKMYDNLIERLRTNGLQQYEISNFAKLGYESRHNLLYWDNESYFGFGAGAHGYINGTRTINAGPLRGYFRLINENGTSIKTELPVSLQEQIEEEMFLGLRKSSGVNKTRFYHKYQTDIHQIYGKAIDKLKSRGLIFEDENIIALTKQGTFLGNEVFQEFLI